MKEALETLLTLERRLHSLARDLRDLRKDLARDSASKGALGSRGLTQFLLDQLSSQPAGRFKVSELTRLASAAGYATPSQSDLSRRLSAYRLRTGKVDFIQGEGWGWAAGHEVEEDGMD